MSHRNAANPDGGLQIYGGLLAAVVMLAATVLVVSKYGLRESVPDLSPNPPVTAHADAPSNDPAAAAIMSMVPNPPPTKAVVTNVDHTEAIAAGAWTAEPIPEADCVPVDLSDEKHLRICAGLTEPLVGDACMAYLADAWKRSDATVSPDFIPQPGCPTD
jgi:hypothetical protein